jgi:GntR family transcriptional regulator
MISIMETKHDNSSGNEHLGPLYSQIQQKILQALERGVWRSGELIPSEFELASKYQVSQGTIRKAIDELVGKNLLIRRQGSGTFVATHQEEQSKYRFLHIANQDGKFEDSQNKILHCLDKKAPQEVSKIFGLGPNDDFVHIIRLMHFQNQPVVFEEIWLPKHAFLNLDMELLNSWSGTMYGLFESYFGIHMVSANERIRAVLPSSMAQDCLKIDQITPVLDIFRIAYTFGNKPIEVRQAQCLTNDYHYFNHLS